MSIGRARSTALSVDFSFILRSLFSWMAPVMVLATWITVPHRGSEPKPSPVAEDPVSLPNPFFHLFRTINPSLLVFMEYFRKFWSERSMFAWTRTNRETITANFGIIGTKAERSWNIDLTIDLTNISCFIDVVLPDRSLTFCAYWPVLVHKQCHLRYRLKNLWIAREIITILENNFFSYKFIAISNFVNVIKCLRSLLKRLHLIRLMFPSKAQPVTWL